jgi:hypothetical protein
MSFHFCQDYYEGAKDLVGSLYVEAANVGPLSQKHFLTFPAAKYLR